MVCCSLLSNVPVTCCLLCVLTVLYRNLVIDSVVHSSCEFVIIILLTVIVFNCLIIVLKPAVKYKEVNLLFVIHMHMIYISRLASAKWDGFPLL